MSGSDLPRRALSLLNEEKAKLEGEVFSSPPADWAEFQRRYGRWLQNKELFDELFSMSEGREDRES